MKATTDNEAAPSRSVKTSLDLLPAGDEGFFEREKGKTRSQKRTLPDGVTSRALYGDVLRLAWPALIELTLASLVSMVDMMMVGDLGTGAISAVSLATQPKFVFLMLVMSLNTGSTALVARARGINDRSKANLILNQTMFIMLFISIFGALVGWYTAKPLVRFMSNNGISEATILEGTAYLQIQMAGFPTVAFTSAITAVLRGIGNSHSAMIYNTVANGVNVVFNWLLIGGNLGFPALGVAGASIATVVGQAVGCLMAFYCVLSGRHYVRLSFKTRFVPDLPILKEIAKVGIPAMGEQLVMRIGIIIFSRTVATLGEVPLATHNVCMNIQTISFMNGQAFAVSATSLVGQSLGKKRPDMAQQYSVRCRRLGMLVAVVLGAVFAIFGREIVWLYNKDAEVLHYGGFIMLIVAALQPIQGSQFILSGALRGAGDTRVIAVITFITVLILRTSLGILFIDVLHFGLYGAWWAIAADQGVRSILVLLRYNSGKWKQIKLKI